MVVCGGGGGGGGWMGASHRHVRKIDLLKAYKGQKCLVEWGASNRHIRKLEKSYSLDIYGAA